MAKLTAGVRSVLMALAASAVVAACGGGGGDPGTTTVAPPAGSLPPTGSGTLRVGLTDAPRCRVGNADLDHVFVTVERVRVHESSADDPPAGGWRDVDVLDPATSQPGRKIDLLELTNGRLEELGTLPLPAGTYSQVRLVLSPNRGSNVANSLVLAGQTEEIPLRTPSAAQSGLKIIHPFTVQPNTLVDLVIDFDACRSIVRLGNGNGGYLMKPILTAHRRIVAAIRGFVDPAIASVTTVSAQTGGAVVRSTIPDASGEFVLAFLDPSAGPYDVVVTSPARGTSVVGGVQVSTTNSIVELSTAAQPIPLPAAASPKASRIVNGLLGPDGARVTGVVRALQAIGASVPVAEVATDNVDGATGAFILTLPVASPLFAAYSTTLPLVFATPGSPPPDFSYKLEATAAGYAQQTLDIGTGAADVNWDPTLAPAGP